MGEARRRKEEISNLKSRNFVRHITKHNWFEMIVDQNRLELEGSNSHAIPQNPAHLEMLQAQYTLVGRYVWFTKQRNAKCAGANSELYFEFAQDEMRFEKWSHIVSSLSGSARTLADILNRAARIHGDDPEQWYVSRTSVSLDRCTNRHMFREMRAKASLMDRRFQKTMRELHETICAANDDLFNEVA